MSLNLFPETVKVELLHPIDQTPTGLTIELVGTDNDDVKFAFAKNAKKVTIKDGEDPAAILEASIQVYATTIVGWTVTPASDFNGVFTKLGFPDATFSREKAVALLSIKTAGWVRQQLDKAMGDRESFFKSASLSSSTP